MARTGWMHIEDNIPGYDPEQLKQNGFQLLRAFYTPGECDALVAAVATAADAGQSEKSVYALRQVSEHVPDFSKHIIGSRCLRYLRHLFNATPVLVKSLWFNKPADANWFVPWHQDSTITINRQRATTSTADLEQNGYVHWTKKGHYAGVQPPLPVLEQVWTMRIHLDDATAENGALWVLPGSHRLGFIRNEKPVDETKAQLIEAKRGDVLLMSPLLLHRSSRASVHLPRRVLHLEFSDYRFPDGLLWAENIALRE